VFVFVRCTVVLIAVFALCAVGVAVFPLPTALIPAVAARVTHRTRFATAQHTSHINKAISRGER
jgi:hypothetical protein